MTLERRLGEYELEVELGRGAMGTVYRAKQLSLDRDVAIKVLSPEYANDPAYVERFLREAKAVLRRQQEKVLGCHRGQDRERHNLAVVAARGREVFGRA